MVTVPSLGELVGHIGLLRDETESGRTVLTLLPEEKSSGLVLRREPIDLQSVEWPALVMVKGVLPGRYTAVVQRAPSQYFWKGIYDVSTPQAVEVLAGEVTHLYVYR